MNLLMTCLTVMILGVWIAAFAALGLMILARVVNIVVKEFLNN